jgi:type VI secretion system protein ImpA
MPLRDDLLTPIPGANPSGADLRYDPVTDKIKEARRQEFEAPQGAWKTSVKVADYAEVVKLAGEVLAARSKDLQIAVWLVDAHIRRESFGALAPSFRFLQELCGTFWDTLYPEIEDGDLEMRAAPLGWLGSKLDEPIRLLPVTTNGLSWFRYRESRTVGYEAQADNNDKRKLRERAINEGKITAEEFDQAVDGTPKGFYEAQLAAIREAQGALEQLISFLDEKFGDESPSFTRVRTALEDNAQLVREFVSKKKGSPQPAPAPAPAVVSQPVAPAAVAPVAVVAVQPVAVPVAQPQAHSTTPEPSDFDDAGRRIATVARYLRARDKYDISAYLILRGLRWGEIRYNGPDIDRSMLTPPDSDLREKLAQAFNASQWDRVLALTEEAMELPCSRAWLDLQRFAVKALEGKGPYFAFVADAIRSEIRGLVQDLPTIVQMQLRDGTPTADPATLAWLEEEVLAGVPRSAAPAPVPVAQVEAAKPRVELPRVDLIEKPPQLESGDLSENGRCDVFDDALKKAGAGDLPEALNLLQRELTSEHSGRGRFKRRVQLAHLLMAAGRDQVAQPLLDEVAREIDDRKLEEWEDGDALAYPLSLLLRCATQDPEKKQRLYAAVCRLAPMRALEISG